MLFGGSGADRLYGGDGNDTLHALAADGKPDVLNCGRGDDTAFVLRSERPTTKLVSCERVFIEVTLTPDQNADENGDTDSDADG